MVPHVRLFPSVAEARRHLQKNNKRYTNEWVDVGTEMAEVAMSERPFAVKRNRHFIVQLYHYETKEWGMCVRLSCNRTNLDVQGNWCDGITWDELQEIKSKCGYGDRVALEVFPEDSELIMDSNMRHLIVLPLNTRPSFAWTRKENAAE